VCQYLTITWPAGTSIVLLTQDIRFADMSTDQMICTHRKASEFACVAILAQIRWILEKNRCSIIHCDPLLHQSERNFDLHYISSTLSSAYLTICYDKEVLQLDARLESPGHVE
jgi:hypothetical protein